jgi:ligand-binding SRPBCC domain-containing protein
VSGDEAFSFALASLLYAAREDVWARVGTIDGVNLELAPWLRVTASRHVRRLEDLPTGEVALRSWILALGLVPVDVARLRLVRVDPLHGFLERSALLSQRVWEHERVLHADPAGTLLVDRVAAQPRVPALRRAHAAAFRAAFAHRHRRLRAAFGGTAAPVP